MVTRGIRVASVMCDPCDYSSINTASCIYPAGRMGWHSAGVTLIELMVSISVLVILLTIAAPSFKDIMVSSRAVSLSNELVAALNLARSEAVKRGANVTVCKSQDPGATTPVCSTSANWVNGWLVFADDSTLGSVDVGDARLKVGEPAQAGGSGITVDAVFSNYISFLPSGAAQGNGSGSSGSFAVCVSGIRRTVSVGSTGSIQVSKGAC